MAFGFSVGDFIAVGNLIKDISSCLQDAGGSKAEYQELLRELECLQQALQHLDKLQDSGSSLTNLDSIKYAALSCRQPLEQFLRKIRKYDKSLGVWDRDSIIKSTTDKLRWGFGQKEAVSKLQSYLNIHIGTINILLAEHGLEKMSLVSDQASADQLHIRERLDNTRGIIKKISGCLTAQALVIQSTQNTLARLLEMISGEFRTSWRSFGDMVAKLCVSTQQTYAIVCEIKSSLVGLDTQWSFFQAPLVVEDALGYKFLVPSEYDFDLMDAVVKQKFKAGPGSLEVQAGNYEYFKTKNSTDVLSRNSQLLPGTAITMAIIVVRPTLTDETCPMPRCGSTQTVATSGGCRICCKCEVQFSPTKKKRKSLHDLVSATWVISNSSTIDDYPDDYLKDTTRASKRVKLAPVEEDEPVFRNVRLSDDQFPTVASSFRKHFDDTFLDFMDLWNATGRTQASSRLAKLMEFNDAIRYMNKIKHRYLSQPDIYQRFFEIILTYERESTPILDVYDQMTNLLSQAPDLLEDFKLFLPEPATAAKAYSMKFKHSWDSSYNFRITTRQILILRIAIWPKLRSKRTLHERNTSTCLKTVEPPSEE